LLLSHSMNTTAGRRAMQVWQHTHADWFVDWLTDWVSDWLFDWLLCWRYLRGVTTALSFKNIARCLARIGWAYRIGQIAICLQRPTLPIALVYSFHSLAPKVLGWVTGRGTASFVCRVELRDGHKVDTISNQRNGKYIESNEGYRIKGVDTISNQTKANTCIKYWTNLQFLWLSEPYHTSACIGCWLWNIHIGVLDSFMNTGSISFPWCYHGFLA
jgi:hypothetical protein